MKKWFIFQAVLAFLVILPGNGNCDPLDDLMKQFSKEYDAEKPPPYSSVDSDYKLGQAALGSLYTTRTLGLLYRQNQQLLDKYDTVIQKYDRLIDQNEQIIELLSAIVHKGESKQAGGQLINK